MDYLSALKEATFLAVMYENSHVVIKKEDIYIVLSIREYLTKNLDGKLIAVVNQLGELEYEPE
jgi:hypothetical protein